MFRFSVSDLLRAAAWMAVSAVTFAASSAAAKFLGQKLPTSELAFFRSVFGVLFLIGIWRIASKLRNAKDPAWYVIRCGLGMLALYSLLYAFATIPLAVASLIFFSRVLMLPLTAQLMLGERSSPLVWVALAIGFSGVTLSLYPTLSVPELRLGAIAAVVAAVASAGSQTAVRRLTATNDPGLVVFIYTAVLAVGTFPVALPTWTAPPFMDFPILAGLGLFAVLAQYSAARAFKLAPVGYLAPFDFLAIPASATLGFLLFTETPNVYMLAGSGLVLLSALMMTNPKNNR